MATIYGNIDTNFGKYTSMCNYILMGYTVHSVYEFFGHNFY